MSAEYWFLMFFREYSCFQVLPYDFVHLGTKYLDMDGNNWLSTGNELFQFPCETGSGMSDGVIIQVGESEDDLKSTLLKAKELRWTKSLPLSKLITFFPRFKTGREKLPPMSQIRSEVESDYDISHVSCSQLQSSGLASSPMAEKTMFELPPFPYPNVLEQCPPHHQPPVVKKLFTASIDTAPQGFIDRAPEGSSTTRPCSSTIPPRDSSAIPRQPSSVVPRYQPQLTDGERFILKKISLVSSNVESLQRDVKEISLQLKVICEHNSFVNADDTEFDFPRMSSEVDYIQFKQNMMEDKYKNKVVNVLLCEGGSSAEEMTKRILRRLMTDNFCCKFNRYGTFGKYNFGECLEQLVITVVLKKFNNVDKKSIEDCIRRNLKYAVDRNGGREKRRKVKDADKSCRDELLSNTDADRDNHAIGNNRRQDETVHRRSQHLRNAACDFVNFGRRKGRASNATHSSSDDVDNDNDSENDISLS